jgi:SHAQKYF class myb-like DNA-binding protein
MTSLAVGTQTQVSLASPASAPRLAHAHYSSLSPTSSEDKQIDGDTGIMAFSPGRDSAGVGMWTDEEHARFLEAVKLFVNGPWKRVADYVGTRSVRQTMTHAQKYRLKAARRLRNMRAKSDLLLRHSLGSPGSLPMHPRLLPFTDKDESVTASSTERLTKIRKRSNSSSGKPSKRRHYASLDTVSITDAVSILDSTLLASTSIATTDVRDAKVLTPTASNPTEEVRPADRVKEEAPSQPEEKEEELNVDMDMDMDMELANAIEAILDSDLEACPSLEDCASELLDLLF